MMVGVTKWPYDQASIDRRQGDCDYYGEDSANCHNEAWFIREMSHQFQDKFNLTRNFTFAFMDSYSQAYPGIEDEIQQEHWVEETSKLWKEATGKNETFDFKTIDDVLEENAACKQEVLRLTDIIDEEIANLNEAVLANSKLIEHTDDNLAILSSEVTLNTIQIGETTDEIQLVSTTLTENINEVSINLTEISSTLTENIDEVSSDVMQLASNLTQFKGEVDISMAPVGTIIAWTMRVEANGTETEDIPAGWQRCDGSVIQAPSVWVNLRTPDLNTEKRFLRGGSDQDVLTLEEDMMQNHEHSVHDSGHSHDYLDYSHFKDGVAFTEDDLWVWRFGTGVGSWSHQGYDSRTTFTSNGNGLSVKGVSDDFRSGAETRPRNMNVVFIMRVF